MKVKICGITSIEDALVCEALGADALGFVHVPGRTRSRPLEDVSAMCASVGPITKKMLICAPSSVDDALKMLERSRTDGLQLYSLGPSEAGQLRAVGATVFRALGLDRVEAARFANDVDAIVFEGGTPGTGTSYDYSMVPVHCCPRAIISGGLRPSNVDHAKRLGPYGLDVSSGVERIPGRKDPGLVAEFIRMARG